MRKSNKRTHDIHLQLNDQEFAALEKNRARCSLPQQKYLRQLILEKTPMELPPHEYFEMLKELGRIGNNLNQIAMVANSKGFIDTESYWENVRQLQASVGKIRDGVW